MPEYQKTGLTALDNLLGGGLKMGSLTTIYGDPRSGRSVFVRNIAHLAMSDVRGVAIFDQDTATSKLFAACRCAPSPVEERPPLVSVFGGLESVFARMTELVHTGMYKFVILDYLNFFEHSGVSSFTNLCLEAKNLGVAVIAVFPSVGRNAAYSAEPKDVTHIADVRLRLTRNKGGLHTVSIEKNEGGGLGQAHFLVGPLIRSLTDEEIGLKEVWVHPIPPAAPSSMWDILIDRTL
jgi:Rad51